MGIWYAGRMKYRFHDLELDAGRGLLRRDGEEVDLEPRAFAVLSFLVAHRDRVVSKDELVEAVWDGRFISDDAIPAATAEDEPFRPSKRAHESILMAAIVQHGLICKLERLYCQNKPQHHSKHGCYEKPGNEILPDSA